MPLFRYLVGGMRAVLWPLWLMGLLSGHQAQAQAITPTYTLGLIPQGTALSMHRRWAPLVKRLSRETGLDFKLRLYEHVSEFEQALAEGQLDLAYLNSTQEAMAFNHQGYMPLVRSSKKFKGAVFVHRDSPIQSLDDLRNQDIAFVSERSLCSVTLRQNLQQESGDASFNIIYAGSSSNVYKNVILGRAVAGGTLDVSLLRESPEIISRLRPIYETPELAPHPIAVHPRHAQTLGEPLTQAMLRIAEDPAGQKLLRKVRMPSPLMRADYQRDYQWLEKYMLE